MFRVRRALDRRDALGAALAATQAAPGPGAEVDRIDTLTNAARTSWFALLSYLAFIGVTLMGVSHADFFNPDRQTDLPLVGVAIPTQLFFTLAPLLGAALFAYHQFHLLKLWEVLATVRAPAKVGGKPLSDLIAPWLVNDFALGNRPDRSLRPRPLRTIAHLVALCLVFLATPVVLFFFWWWSMPAHEEMLTVVWCGLPFLAALFVSAKSWARMWRLTDRSRRPIRWRLGFWVPVWLVVSYVGWCATEGTLTATLRNLGVPETALAPDRPLGWLSGHVSPLPLARANLAGEDMIGIPADWRAREPAEIAFRRDWCGREGIPLPGCLMPKGSLTGSNADLAAERAFVHDQRRKFCAEALFGGDASQGDCTGYFSRAEAAQTRAWNVYRRAQLRALNVRSLAGRDLRDADLGRMRLEGADFTGARLTGASLYETSAEGGTFSDAMLAGAWAHGAKLQDALFIQAAMTCITLSASQVGQSDLSFADLRGAIIDNTDLSGADLLQADVTGADLDFVTLNHGSLQETVLAGALLKWVSFEGAVLLRTDLTGALPDDVLLDADTDLEGADLAFAGLRSLDWTQGARLSQAQVDAAFGAASVALPPGLARPAHWPGQALDQFAFPERWRAWQAAQGYTPPAAVACPR